MALRNLSNSPEKLLKECCKIRFRETMINLRRLVRGLRPIYLEEPGIGFFIKNAGAGNRPAGQPAGFIPIHGRRTSF